MLTLQEMSNRAHEAHELMNDHFARSLDSTSDSKVASLLQTESGWSTKGSVEPVKNTLSYARAYMGAALDHLAGAAIAVNSSASFDVDSLSRSSVEAAALRTAPR